MTTSPSINPDYPTTEPRLRAQLQALVAARAAGDPDAPALVSEADLFLRLCPAPTIGVTGTKGKTTTSALAHAILAADPLHPAVLGGNIGTPLVERLPELTPDHRVVDRAVRAPAADPVARHDGRRLHQRDLRPPRPARLASRRTGGSSAGSPSWSTRTARSCSTSRTRSSAAYAGPRHRAGRPVPERPPGAGRPRRASTAGSSRRPWSGCRSRAAASRRRDPAAGSCRSTSSASRARHNVSNALAAIAVGLLFGVAPDAIRRAAAAFTGVEHRLQSRRPRRRRAVRQRLPGHPARRGHRRAARVPGARRADRRRPRQGRRPRASSPGSSAQTAAAAVLIGESGPALEAMFREAGLARTARAAHDGRGGRDRRRARARWRWLDARGGTRSRPCVLSPAAASFDMFEDYAARGRAFIDAVARLAAGRGSGPGGTPS